MGKGMDKSKRKKQPFGVKPDKLNSDRIGALTLHLEYSFDKGCNFRDRTIVISQDIEDLFEFVDAALTEMEAMSHKIITIKLNSYGGFIHEALAVVGRIKTSPCVINVEVYGKCMSAAMLIFASGNKRSVSRFAWGMHHISSYSLNGTHTQNRNEVRQNDREHKGWCYWMSKFSNRDEKYWSRTGSKVDKYYSPEELIEIGVADEII